MQEQPQTSEVTNDTLTEQTGFNELPSPPPRRGRRWRQFQAMLSMYTPYRERTRGLWHKSIEIDYGIKRPPSPIAEINAAHMSRETLRRATRNFREPAVVRGLFEGAPALQKWPTTEYLPSSSLGDQVLPVIMNANYRTKQDDWENITFRDAFLDVVQHQTQKYLFFPIQSRFQKQTESDNGEQRRLLEDAVNQIVRQDLSLDRIWPGFGSPRHRRFAGVQMIIGYGQRTPETTTGSGWHCAQGNRMFRRLESLAKCL
jgi:hypothetical protein